MVSVHMQLRMSGVVFSKHHSNSRNISLNVHVSSNLSYLLNDLRTLLTKKASVQIYSHLMEPDNLLYNW